MSRKLMTLILLVLAVTAIMAGAVTAKTPEPTQTPYVVYLVVTATPEPEPEAQIERPSNTSISLVNTGSTAAGSASTSSSGSVSLTNDTLTEDQIVASVVSTLTAQSVTTAGGSATVAKDASSSATTTEGCTIAFELISEPTYGSGCFVQRGETFWKEWVIQNTGTCTWTPEYTFVFDSGWQIGNTSFSMNKTTAPGETLTVKLGMTPDQQRDGTYYSTYVLKSPDGTKGGTITSTYNVRGASWFAPTATPVPWGRPWAHGVPAGPEGPGGPRPPRPPRW